VMASKGKEVVIANPSLKRLQKGTKGPSSSASKKAKYAPENWIDEGRLVLEFSTIRDKVPDLEFGYIFVELEECNLTL
ncbi:hypothetical protein HAX54_022893, partial [Datura stramonium]|nr:hypothetical protein [Datura stramonium]